MFIGFTRVNKIDDKEILKTTLNNIENANLLFFLLLDKSCYDEIELLLHLLFGSDEKIYLLPVTDEKLKHEILRNFDVSLRKINLSGQIILLPIDVKRHAIMNSYLQYFKDCNELKLELPKKIHEVVESLENSGSGKLKNFFKEISWEIIKRIVIKAIEILIEQYKDE